MYVYGAGHAHRRIKSSLRSRSGSNRPAQTAERVLAVVFFPRRGWRTSCGGWRRPSSKPAKVRASNWSLQLKVGELFHPPCVPSSTHSSPPCGVSRATSLPPFLFFHRHRSSSSSAAAAHVTQCRSRMGALVASAESSAAIVLLFLSFSVSAPFLIHLDGVS